MLYGDRMDNKYCLVSDSEEIILQEKYFLDKGYKDIFYAVGHVRHYLNEDGDYKTSDISHDNLKIVLNACIKTVEDYFYYLNEEED